MTFPDNSLKKDARPLYDQATDALIRFIEDGDYKPGSRLPPEGELAKRLGISRPTLREAMGNLESRGIIVRQHGIGSFVTASAKGIIQGGLERLQSLLSMANSAGVRAERVEWRVEQLPAEAWLAEKLVLNAGEIVVRTQMTARNEECLIAYFDNYTPLKVVDFEELRAYSRGSILDYLLEKEEPNLVYTDTSIYSVGASQEVADRLHMEKGKSLLLLNEIFFTDSGAPIVYALNYFVTDCLKFHIIRRIAHS